MHSKLRISFLLKENMRYPVKDYSCLTNRFKTTNQRVWNLLPEEIPLKDPGQLEPDFQDPYL
jgi:hypothetical protein